GLGEHDLAVTLRRCEGAILGEGGADRGADAQSCERHAQNEAGASAPREPEFTHCLSPGFDGHRGVRPLCATGCTHRAGGAMLRAYGDYFDKGLWAAATTRFTDDARVEIAQRGVYRGRAGVERMYVNVFGRGHNCLPPRGLNNHLILQPIITVAPDGRTATGR